MRRNTPTQMSSQQSGYNARNTFKWVLVHKP